ncbi:hypothetical protein Tco_1570142 [Tanacetum coccineum]
MVINSACLTDKKELAIPKQTTTGKEFSNPLRASMRLSLRRVVTVWKGLSLLMLSLDAAQDSDNIFKTQSTAMLNVDIPQGIDTGGSPRRQETMGVLLLRLGLRVLDLEKEKDAQAVEILNLKKRVKKLERKRKMSASHTQEGGNLTGQVLDFL